MAYMQYDPDLPNGAHSGPTVIDEIKDNLLAVRDAAIMGGGFFGWAMTASGGTAAEPVYFTYAKGTERVRATLTWSSGSVTAALYEYSSTGGASYNTIGTKTINYDGSGNVTGTTWS